MAPTLHSSPCPPHPAVVFISPGPRCAYLQPASGKMATLGDSQEPPRVPSPVNLASPGTPGTCQREAQLHLHGHDHGTHPALHSLRLPAPSARPARWHCLLETRQLTGCRASCTLALGSGQGHPWRRPETEPCERWLPVVPWDRVWGDWGRAASGRVLCPALSLCEPLFPPQENSTQSSGQASLGWGPPGTCRDGCRPVPPSWQGLRMSEARK